LGGTSVLAILLSINLLRLWTRYSAWRTFLRVKQGGCPRCGSTLGGAKQCAVCGTPAWTTNDSSSAFATASAHTVRRTRLYRPAKLPLCFRK
jgi:hypothetical protein